MHCFLTVSLLRVVLWPEEGDSPENLHRAVYVIINKRSFESFNVFGSYFITLAVILVSDLFCFFNNTTSVGTEPNQGVCSWLFVKHPGHVLCWYYSSISTKPPGGRSKEECFYQSVDCLNLVCRSPSSGAVWKSKWPSWAFRHNEPYGFCGRKATLHHEALVTVCP